jgi:hypothetical protein
VFTALSDRPRLALADLKVKVEFRILGPLDVIVDGRAVAFGGRHQRALLALLLVHTNEVVLIDRLIDDRQSG